ncbi:MAG: thioredoxin family protein, partial [Holophagales bacterium]|nr:thioredoxin family protein [Holophagales bacterium]
SVQRVDPDAFSATGELSARLAPIGGPGAVTTFTRSRQVMRFELDGRAYTLRPAPPVLGRQSSLAVGERHPSFSQKSAAFRQNHDQKSVAMSAPVEKAAAEDLMVRVYFGSWSPICERIVPKLMAVEESWGHVRFEYYGLPQPLIDDPHAVDMGITGVPTVVVFRGGQELERLMGRQLDDPSEALTRVLSGS